MEIMESAEQNIITVQPEEIAFFEEFTKKYAISWTREEKLNNILPLSKSYVGYITTPTRIISLNPKYHEIGFEHIIRIYLYCMGTDQLIMQRFWMFLSLKQVLMLINVY